MSYTPPSLDITVTTGGGDASTSVDVEDNNGFDVESMAIASFPANFWIGNGISNIVLNGTVTKLEYSSSNEAGTATTTGSANTSIDVTAFESGNSGVSSETLTITQYTDENGPFDEDLTINVARPTSGAIYSSSTIDVDFPLGATSNIAEVLPGLLAINDIQSVSITNWDAAFADDLELFHIKLFFKDKQSRWDATNSGSISTNYGPASSGFEIFLKASGGVAGLVSRTVNVEYTMVDATVHTQSITINVTRVAVPLTVIYSANTIDANFPLGSTTSQIIDLSGLLAANDIASVNITNWDATFASDLSISYLYLYFKSKRSLWNSSSTGAVSNYFSTGSGLKIKIFPAGGLGGLTSRVLDVEYTLEDGTVHTHAITVNVTRAEDILTVVPDLALEAVIGGGVIVQPLTLSLDVRDSVEGIVRVKPLQLKLKISSVESIKTQDLNLVLFTDENAFSFSESSNWCGQSI